MHRSKTFKAFTLHIRKLKQSLSINDFSYVECVQLTLFEAIGFAVLSLKILVFTKCKVCWRGDKEAFYTLSLRFIGSLFNFFVLALKSLGLKRLIQHMRISMRHGGLESCFWLYCSYRTTTMATNG
jgi:hypothetical protein